MNKIDRLESDLDYVREVVDRADHDPSPRGIYLLWAVLAPVGFALVDFAPQWTAAYWTVAGPAGGLASFWMGWRGARHQGQLNREIGIRHALHWLGMLVGVWLLVALALTEGLPWDSLSQVILLLIALGWYFAGVHLDRPLLWLGILMGVGFVVLLFVSSYAWTVLGVFLGIGLVMTAILSGRKGVEGA